MPDFLKRLAARALDALPVVEPLVPTRFDPGIEHSTLSPFEAPRQASEFSEAATGSADRAFVRHTPATSPESELVRLDQASADPQEGIQPIRSQHRHVSHWEDLEQQFTSEPPRSPFDAQTTRVATFRPSFAIDKADAVLPHSADEKPPHASPLFAEPRVAPTKPASEPSRLPDHRQPRMSATHSAVPMVRVSIGRIEVRAQLPPQAPAPVPQRARASHVSLEQLLKQAGGGAR